MLALRVINANFRMGGLVQAQALAKYAGSSKVTPELRTEALFALGNWGEPHDRDRIMGVYRPLGKRSPGAAVSALKGDIKRILNTAPDAVKHAAIDAVVKLRLRDSVDTINSLAVGAGNGSKLRGAALQALASLRSPALDAAIETALKTNDEHLRATAVELVGNLSVKDALKHLQTALDKGSVVEKQMAFAALGTLKTGQADKILTTWMDSLSAGKLDGTLQLDVLEAAGLRKSEGLQKKVADFDKKQTAAGEMAPWLVALNGGNAERGADIFKGRRDVQCSRCHKIDGKGGEAGPELTNIGAKQNREYLLQALVQPSAKIAEGFENITVEVNGGPEDGGAEFAGVVKRETDTELDLVSFEDGVVTINKKDITFRRKGLSGMPVGLHAMLGKRNLRDLVEYLASLK